MDGFTESDRIAEASGVSVSGVIRESRAKRVDWEERRDRDSEADRWRDPELFLYDRANGRGEQSRVSDSNFRRAKNWGFHEDCHSSSDLASNSAFARLAIPFEDFFVFLSH